MEAEGGSQPTVVAHSKCAVELSVGQSGSQSGLSGPVRTQERICLQILGTLTELSQWRASEETGHSDNNCDIRQLPAGDLLLC